VKKIAHLFLRKSLLDEKTEQDSVPELSEVVEQLGSSIRVLDNIKQFVLIVLEDTGGSVVIPRKLTVLRHSFHQRLGELKNVSLDQRLDHLEQFFNDHSNALVAEQFCHAGEVRRANKVVELRVDGVVGNVEGLASPQVVVGHLRSLVPLDGLREQDIPALDEPVGGCVVAVVGEEVIVELPENMEGDSTVGSQYVVIGLAVHVVEFIQGEMFRKEFVRQLVDANQRVEFNNSGDVSGLETGNGEVERLLETVVDPLADESVQVDRSSE